MELKVQKAEQCPSLAVKGGVGFGSVGDFNGVNLEVDNRGTIAVGGNANYCDGCSPGLDYRCFF